MKHVLFKRKKILLISYTWDFFNSKLNQNHKIFTTQKIPEINRIFKTWEQWVRIDIQQAQRKTSYVQMYGMSILVHVRNMKNKTCSTKLNSITVQLMLTSKIRKDINLIYIT